MTAENPSAQAERTLRRVEFRNMFQPPEYRPAEYVQTYREPVWSADQYEDEDDLPPIVARYFEPGTNPFMNEEK